MSLKCSFPRVRLTLLVARQVLSLAPPKSNFSLRKQNSLYLKRFSWFTHHHLHSYFLSLPSMLEYFSVQHIPLSTLCVFLPRSSSAGALFREKRKKKSFASFHTFLHISQVSTNSASLMQLNTT